MKNEQDADGPGDVCERVWRNKREAARSERPAKSHRNIRHKGGVQNEWKKRVLWLLRCRNRKKKNTQTMKRLLTGSIR